MPTKGDAEKPVALLPARCGAALEPRKVGRPTLYEPALVDRLCKAIAAGMTLREVCREEWAPDHDTLYEWRKQHPAFADALAHARSSCADHLAESCIELIDGVDPDSEYGSSRVSKAREQVGVRRWLAAVNDPRYADRPQVEVKIGQVLVAFGKLSSPTPTDDE